MWKAHAFTALKLIESLKMSDSTLELPKVDKRKKKDDSGALVIVFFIVIAAIGGYKHYEKSLRSPAEIAADDAKEKARTLATQREKRDVELAKKYKTVRESSADAVRDYMLASTGKGICDEVTNSSLSNLRYGTAAFQFAKPEPAVTGSYSADCSYYINGDKRAERQTFWFHITMEEKSGKLEGNILRDNPGRIENGIAAKNFREES